MSAGGRAVRTLSRTPAAPGNNLILSVDIELQKVAEEAFGDWRGALVAIEPSTGDILAYVSQAGLRPEPVRRRHRRAKLERSEYFAGPADGQPAAVGHLHARLDLQTLHGAGRAGAGQAHGQPGGIFDPGFFMLGGHRFNDDVHSGHGTVDLRKSIVVSCNTYYYMLGRDMGIDSIHDFMKPFGFGQVTGIDLDGEKTGVLPSQEWKRSRFKGAAGRWVGGDTISVSNGSGFNSYTPLQIAHAVANLANDGVVMKPHLVKIVEDGVTRARKLTVPTESYRIPLKQENIDFIKNAMVGVASEPGGTAYRAFANAGYTVGGKTGTAQIVGIKANEKYNAARTPERLRDNALFTAFAPAEKPRIVLAMVVENAGWGGEIAAPIARKVLDYYLLGKRPEVKATAKMPTDDAEAQGPVDEAGSDEEAAAIEQAGRAPAGAPAPATAAKPGSAATSPAAGKPAALAPVPLIPTAPPKQQAPVKSAPTAPAPTAPAPTPRPPRRRPPRPNAKNNKERICVSTKDARCGAACVPTSPCSTCRWC